MLNLRSLVAICRFQCEDSVAREEHPRITPITQISKPEEYKASGLRILTRTGMRSVPSRGSVGQRCASESQCKIEYY